MPKVWFVGMDTKHLSSIDRKKAVNLLSRRGYAVKQTTADLFAALLLPSS